MNIVILAAGQGKRMKSALPKVLQTLAGKPLLQHVLNTALSLQGKSSKHGPIVVVGHGAADVKEFLASAAKEAGAPTRFIELADQINLEMPNYFVGRANEMLGGLKGKKVLVIGVAYKPNVADVRETPVASLIAGLEKSGASVSWHDHLVKTWNNQNSVPITDQYDLAIIATPHDSIQLSKLGNTPVLNTRGSK
jgi:UDP-N-acetyl-D-mannosaminuronate dehydrogenase